MTRRVPSARPIDPGLPVSEELSRVIRDELRLVVDACNVYASWQMRMRGTSIRDDSGIGIRDHQVPTEVRSSPPRRKTSHRRIDHPETVDAGRFLAAGSQQLHAEAHGQHGTTGSAERPDGTIETT